MSRFRLISDMGIYTRIGFGESMLPVTHTQVHLMQHFSVMGKHLGREGAKRRGSSSVCCGFNVWLSSALFFPLSSQLLTLTLSTPTASLQTSDLSVLLSHSLSLLFLPAGAALSAARRSPATRRAAGGARRRRCSTSWPASCPSPTASPPTWTRPPS